MNKKDIKRKTANYEKKIKNGEMTINQVRAEFGLSAIPEGDCLYNSRKA